MSKGTQARGPRAALRRVTVAAAVVALGLTAVGTAAVAQNGVLSEEEVAARVAEAYGVEILQVKRDDLIGGPAYAVKVMDRGGESNAAFRVTTLMVDGTTGELIPQFRHRTFGYRPSGTPRRELGSGNVGEPLRLRTFGAQPEAIE